MNTRLVVGLCVGTAAAVALATEARAASDWIKSADNFKRRAVESIVEAQAPGADQAQLGRLSVNSLNVARMLLKKYEEPYPPEVVSAMDDVDALQYWVKRKLVGEARVTHAKQSDVLEADAQLLLEKATAYAHANPTETVIANARYFLIADQYPVTTAGKLALSRLNATAGATPAVAAPGATPASPAGSDAATLVAEYEDILGSAAFTIPEKLAATERLLRSLPVDNPVRPEVMAVKDVLAAIDDVSRAAALSRYRAMFATGRFVSRLDILQPAVAGAEAGPATVAGTVAGAGAASLEELAPQLRAATTNKERAAACRAFLDIAGDSPAAKEVTALVRVYAARYAEDESTAWLAYVVAHPQGIMRATGLQALRRSENWLIMQLKSALTEGDNVRFRAVADLHRELFPRSQSAREVRSLLTLMAGDAAARVKGAATHVRTYPTGYLTDAVKTLLEQWKKDQTAGALESLVEKFAASDSRTARAEMCQEFLREHDRSDAAEEVKAARLICSPSTARSRVGAVKKYLEAYPQGRFVSVARQLEGEYAAELDEEVFRATRLKLEDTRTPYAARLTACDEYLAEFPEGVHADEVRTARAAAQKVIADEQTEYDAVVAALPRIASLEDAIARCTAFMSQHAAGPHMVDMTARRSELTRRLDEKREAEAYEQLAKSIRDKGRSKVSRADECLTFLRTYVRGANSGKVVRELHLLGATKLGPHAGPVRAAAFSASSDHLVTADADASNVQSGLWVWRLPDGSPLKRWAARPRVTATAMCALSDARVLVGERSGGLLIWRYLDGAIDARARLGRSAVNAIGAAGDGTECLTTLDGDGKARLWSLPDPALTESYAARGGVTACAFTPDGDTVAVGTADGNIAVYRASGGEPVWAADGAHRGPVDCLAFSPNGSALASTGSRGGTVRMWGGLSGNELWKAEEKSTSVAFAGSDKLVTGPSLREATNGDVTYELAGTGTVAASPDGRFVVTGAEEDMATLWYLPAILYK